MGFIKIDIVKGHYPFSINCKDNTIKCGSESIQRYIDMGLKIKDLGDGDYYYDEKNELDVAQALIKSNKS